MKSLHSAFRLTMLLSAAVAISFCSQKSPETTVYVERISATSTEEGLLKYDVQNIFGSGEWHSAPSYFPMDGIQMYLLDPSSLANEGTVYHGMTISGMQVNCPGESATQNIILYINGDLYGSELCNRRIEMNGYVTSIFILGSAEKRHSEKKSFIVSDVDFLIKNKEGETVKADVIYPERIEGSVTASSVLTPASAFRSYFAFDGRTDFGWSEGAKNSGEGEILNVSLGGEEEISGLEIYTGFQMSQSHFEKNAVPVALEIKSGSEVQKVTLKPVMGSQRILLNPPLRGKKFSLKILASQKGSVWQDALISDITLLKKDNRRLTVFDPSSEIDTKSLKKSMESTILSEFVDQALFSKNPLADYRIQFRSNASFVIWSSSPDESIVMDGNWYPVSQEKDSADITIIGKLHKVSTRVEGELSEGSPYADRGQTVTEVNDYVFADNLKISRSGENAFEISAKRINGEFSN